MEQNPSQNIGRRNEASLEASALPSRITYRNKAIEEHKLQTVEDIREHCRRLAPELSDIPLAGLEANLRFPHMPSEEYYKHFAAYAELHLPLFCVIPNLERGRTDLSLNLITGELVLAERSGLLQPKNLGDDVSDRIRPASDEMIYKAAAIFSDGRFERLLARPKLLATAREDTLSRDYTGGREISDYNKVSTSMPGLIDGITHILRGTEPTPEEDFEIKKAVAWHLGHIGSSRTQHVNFEHMAYGFFQGLQNERQSNDSAGTAELRLAFARAICFNTRGYRNRL